MRYLIILISGCSYSGSCEVPYVYNYMEAPNRIEFCTDVKISKERVVDQFQWWHNLSPDYPWFDYEDIEVSDCDYDVEPGVIRITGADLGYMISNMAGAYTSFEVSNMLIEDSEGKYKTYNTELVMNGAVIYLKPWNTDNVIRHEIGHAYGWDHVSGDHHLMSPTTGNETCGLEEWNLFSAGY